MSSFLASGLAFLVLSAFVTLAQHDVRDSRGCGNTPTPAQVEQYEANFAIQRSSFSIAAADAIVGPIPVVWHVIYSNETLRGGYIPDSQVEGSIAAMNEHYAGTGVSFVHTLTNRVQNETWFKWVEPTLEAMEYDMKSLTRVGEAATLNIWSVGFNSPNNTGLLGYATFPDWYNDPESGPKRDGVVILYSSVPGGTSTPYNQGKTLTHEVGHWLGLYHVFQGGCAGTGDFVDDTPPQQTATRGCPATQDSCPGVGMDSIHNMMDYSIDSCLTEFTHGQIARMREQVLVYRNISIPSIL